MTSYRVSYLELKNKLMRKCHSECYSKMCLKDKRREQHDLCPFHIIIYRFTILILSAFSVENESIIPSSTFSKVRKHSRTINIYIYVSYHIPSRSTRKLSDYIKLHVVYHILTMTVMLLKC